TPQKTEGTPQKTEGTPQKTEGTPQKTEGTPQKTEGTPLKTEGTPQKTEGTPQKTADAPQKTALKILIAMRQNPKITRKELAAFLAIREDTVKEHISKLVSFGRLRRVGPDKGGHWEVLDLGQPTVKEQ
ncbi:MAG: winged helix-turn-helix transcriptional regulator, partial [Victivallales bacterium]|nr:winged helix-turn-helix transcriptional regulator [Victivallales bacterium]